MRIAYPMLATAACASIVSTASFAALQPTAIGTRCDVTGWNYYCQTVEGLARTYGYMIRLHDLRSGGASPDSLRVIYGSQCSFIPPGIRAVVRENRVFRTKEGPATLVKVDFDGKQLLHEEDRYTAEGEYKGRVTVSHTAGWMLRKDLTCPAQQ